MSWSPFETLRFYLTWSNMGKKRIPYLVQELFKTPIRDIPISNLPMILIGQIQRSGGTLLSQLLDAHPQIYSHPPELYWGKPMKWDWPSFEALNKFSDRELYRLLYQAWIIDSAVKKKIEFGKKTSPMSFPFDFSIKIHRETFFRLLSQIYVNSRRAILNSYLLSFYSAWRNYQNIGGEKKYHSAFIPRTSMHRKSVTRFFQDYPDGYLVHVIRHPGAWWASANRHSNEYKKIDSLELWAESTRQIIDLKKLKPDRIICINFENLICDPKATLIAFCEKVSLDWDKSLLTPTFNSIPVPSDSSFHSETPGKLSADVVERYKSRLSKPHIKIIEKKFYPLYEKTLSISINGS